MDIVFIHAKHRPQVVGASQEMKKVLEQCQQVAKADDVVLFRGEVGTGKQLLATYVHYESERGANPLCLIDCSHSPNLLDNSDEGLEGSVFDSVRGGAIFFKEIACLSLAQQKRLAEVCQQAINNNIRVYMTTSQNIDMLLFEKAFNKELYDLATRTEIVVPPLRQRTDDIPELVTLFLTRLNRQLRKSIQGLTPQVQEIFMNYRWPQNVQELKYVLTRAAIVTNEPYIGQMHLQDSLGRLGQDQLASYDVMPLDKMEEILLRLALNRYGNTLEGKKHAARSLNISLATLYNKLKRYNLNA